MPEDIGHFRVILEGEVSPKLGDNLEKDLKKSSEKISDNLEKNLKTSFEKISDNLKKELEKAINKTSFGRLIDNGKQFAQKISNTFDIPSGKISNKISDNTSKVSTKVTPELSKEVNIEESKSNIQNTFMANLSSLIEKISNISSDTSGKNVKYADPTKTSYVSMTNKESKQPLAANIGKSEGSASGVGGLLGGIMGLVAKISIVAGLIGLVVKVLDGLAPIQALIKMLVAIIQITLYPIMQFFLALFKPILLMLMKYLILPFYYNVMPVLTALGKWIGETIAGILSDPAGAIMGLWKFVVDGTLAVLGSLWDSLKEIWNKIVNGVTTVFGGIAQILMAYFKVIMGLFFGIGNYMVTVISGIVQNIVNIFTFLAKTLLGVLNVILSPFINLISRIVKNPLDAIGAFAAFGSEIANTGDRIGAFAGEVVENWQELQSKTILIAINIKDSALKIFTDFFTNMKNVFTITKTVAGEIFGNIADNAVSAFGSIGTAFSGLVDGMKSTVSSALSGGISKGGGGESSSKYGTETVPTWTSPIIRAAISQQGSTRYANPMAEGGIVDKPMIALIGEKGPEAVIPLKKLDSMGGNNITINNTFNDTKVSSDRDIDEIIRKIERTFYVTSKRSGIKS